MALIHPAALNMAFTTITEEKPQRCRCWLVLAIVLAVVPYFMLMRTLAHMYRP
jgi:hypothetical protein